ncbi:MAG: malate:quinone oxidoreductase, partial [Bacteroidota bacterium]|nr:malate:quinone oxidoreductase [Bacteroidota bacterium]
STAVSIMLSLLQRCFPERFNTEKAQTRIKQMIPSFGESLGKNEQLLHEIRSMTAEVLGIKETEPVQI